jgi:putative oxidoreductase
MSERTREELGLGILIARSTTGTLMFLHGCQKLFGWWNGPGLEGWTKHTEGMGMKPAGLWATVSALGEFCGGAMTALGLLNPLGPLAIMSTMVVAIRKAHWDKPVFVSDGGAELALSNMGVAAAVIIEGPGMYSMDRLIGWKIPGWMRLVLATGCGAFVGAALKPALVRSAAQRMGVNLNWLVADEVEG